MRTFESSELFWRICSRSPLFSTTYMVEFIKTTLELVVERGQSARLLVLILDDALLIGDDMSLHPSTL